MTIPIKYRTSPEGIISITSEDFITGVGYQTLYLCAGDSNESYINFLSTKQLFAYADPTGIAAGANLYIDETYSTSSTTYADTLDKDFDIEIQNPFNLRGVVFANVAFSNDEDSTNFVKFKVKVIVRHFDGTTEANLLTMTTTEQTNSNGINDYYFCLRGEIVEKKFEKGDKLRVTVIIQTASNVGSAVNGTVYLGLDPQNRVNAALFGNYDRTDSIIYIPLKVDL